MDRSKIVVLKRFTSAEEAELFKALLGANGIESALLNATASGVLPIQTDLMEVELAVNEKDAKLARQILNADFDHKEFEEESSKKRRKP